MLLIKRVAIELKYTKSLFCLPGFYGLRRRSFKKSCERINIMQAIRLLFFAVCISGISLSIYAQPTWSVWESTTYEQQGESLYVSITFSGNLNDKGLIHAGNTFYNDYDDNAETGQPGSVGSETNLTFAEWDADNTWCMRVYGLWDQSIGTFIYRALTPVNLSADGRTLSYKHSLVGLGLEDISYFADGYWLDGSNWWNDPYTPGSILDEVGLYSFNTTLIPDLDTSLVGTKSRLKIPEPYKTRAESENIITALDEIVTLLETEIGAVSSGKPYTITYNVFSDYPVFIYVDDPNNQFTTYIPGNQWVDEPNWWAMLEGAVFQTMAEFSDGYREIFMTQMATDIPLPNTEDGWYTTRFDSTHGLKWTTNNKVTFKAIIGRAFHNLITIYFGENLSHTDANAAATAARTRAADAYAAFSGNAFDLDPWIMTGFLLDKVGSDLNWTKQLYDILPFTFEVPSDTTAGDAFGQLVKPYLRDGVADGSLPYATRKYWYQNIASVQAAAIDAVTGGDIYNELKAITDYPTIDSVYNQSRIVFEEATDVEHKGPNVIGTFYLTQNYPNPFNPSTKITFSIPEHAQTVLKVFDILGRDVIKLLDKDLAQGEYEIDWNAVDIPAGIYFYRLESGKFVSTKKAVLLK